ncbi:GNAT family N-acetyltransferase [Staphylococcus sp. IVB6238]|uniref:GNAT family N-acetyltransferase n=1 Tax=unclassified Staphylococcus TaxID=91994 RepID=UPI0021D28E56|nr:MULTISPECIES: GNAT family protein [unclassified Staphylococcus]UXR71169.1 GNAT family N-acetyltransferase [Staphylococcus sp. IVB6240]UXR73442.1 GNAT family N-acetyltransferase [Staphylococcus sp. IVB6238]UXR79957.1 GNAT family N-acetyltransferase [Staphylococcus sp. IVB6218]
MKYNAYNQPIGDAVSPFENPKKPVIEILEGKYSKLERLNMRHRDDLFEVLCDPENDSNWTYLPNEPIHDKQEFNTLIHHYIDSDDPYFFAIVDKTTDKALGLMSLLRINTKASSIEVGHIHYSPLLKRTRIATEVQYLLAKYVFESLGYRRYEWKCDSLNAPSKRAAVRLGFTHEGTFRQALVYKGRNRDTDWFSMLDKEWPNIKQHYEYWLDEKNFNSDGTQIQKLSIT